MFLEVIFFSLLLILFGFLLFFGIVYLICDFGNFLKFFKWVLGCKELFILFMRKRRTVNKFYCKIYMLNVFWILEVFVFNKLLFIGVVRRII